MRPPGVTHRMRAQLLARYIERGGPCRYESAGRAVHPAIPPVMTDQLDRCLNRGQAVAWRSSVKGHTGPMTHVEHQPWCTHHHHVDLTDAADLSNGGGEDWCCYRGPRDSSGRRIEITDHNRFLGVKITDWVYPGEAMTAEDARELIAGIEAALDHVDGVALGHEATRIAAPAVIG